MLDLPRAQALLDELQGIVGQTPWLSLPEIFAACEDDKAAKLDSWKSQAAARANVLRLLGHLPTRDLTIDHVNWYYDKRVTEQTRYGRRPTIATMNREVASLRAALNWAVKWRKIPSNPIGGITLRPENNLRRTVIRWAQVVAMAVATPNPIARAFLVALYDSGMRFQELLRLRWDDLDLETGRARLLGCDTKSDRPRHPRIAKFGRLMISLLPRIGEFIFANPETKRPYFPSHVSRLIARAVDVAGLVGVAGEKISAHLIRHGYIARCRRLRIPLNVVMTLTGHRTLEAFQRYGWIDDDEADGVVYVLDEDRETSEADVLIESIGAEERDRIVRAHRRSDGSVVLLDGDADEQARALWTRSDLGERRGPKRAESPTISGGKHLTKFAR